MAKDIIVVAEHLKGELTENSFETLGAARVLADEGGEQVVAILPGHGIAELAGQLVAADRVLAIDDPALAQFTPEAYLAVLETVLRERKPRLALLPNTALGMDLAAALAVRLDWPLVAYCTSLRVEGAAIVATSQIYGGKILAESVLGAEPSVATMVSGAGSADAGRKGDGPAIEVIAAPGAFNGLRTRFGQLVEPEEGDVDITRAERIVSVGRGIQSKDNIALAEELAESLGGVVAASRPVIDSGWLPRTRQVGKSGLRVKPKLYLCLGISGAPEHLEGMRDAQLIIAVNTDPKAPVFDVAHFGVVADLFDFADALQEALEE